jgi:starvation-inducible DNA-binding protein
VDTLDLMLQAKQTHWTVTGMNFLSLHQVFDKISTKAGEFGDFLAKCIMQLHERAEGQRWAIVLISQLEPCPVTLSHAEEHVERMSSTLARYAHGIRKAIRECEHRDDATTAEFSPRSGGGPDKWLWLVESHKGRR